jgi:hypothetical protein
MHVLAFNVLGNAKILVFVSPAHGLQKLDSSSPEHSVVSTFLYAYTYVSCLHSFLIVIVS